jgi:hypothetical protein
MHQSILRNGAMLFSASFIWHVKHGFRPMLHDVDQIPMGEENENANAPQSFAHMVAAALSCYTLLLLKMQQLRASSGHM